MIFRDTSKKDIDITKRSRFMLQKGGEGATVGKYVLNEAGFYPAHPNDYIIPFAIPTIPPTIPENYKVDMNPLWYPFVNTIRVESDRSTYAFIWLESSYEGFFHKFKAGDQIVLKRQNIKRRFTIASVTRPLSTWAQINLLNDRSYETDSFDQLDHFIGPEGYSFGDNVASSDTFLYVGFERKIENSPRKIVLNDFYVDFNEYEYSDTCSIKAVWETDYMIKAIRLRWRTVPRNDKSVELFSPTVAVGGEYSFPIGVTPEVSATVVSATGDTGRSATIELGLTQTGATYTISNVIVTNEGGGYLQRPSFMLDNTYAVNSGVITMITEGFVLRTEGKIDHIQVLDGGYGYTGASVSISPLTSLYYQGTTAQGYAEIEDGVIKNIVLTDPGYLFTIGFFKSPCDIVITPYGTGGTGAVLKANIDIASEWTYGDPMCTEKSAIISGIKRGLPYEIQILCSDDELFKGDCRYSNSINFTYY